MLEQQTQTSRTWRHLVTAADADGDVAAAAAAAAAAEASVPAAVEPEARRGAAAGSVW